MSNIDNTTKYNTEAKILIKAFSIIMQLPENDVCFIIDKNILATKFINLENALKRTSDLENIKTLISITLHRKYDDLSLLNYNDVKYIKETYGIKINITKSKLDINEHFVFDLGIEYLNYIFPPNTPFVKPIHKFAKIGINNHYHFLMQQDEIYKYLQLYHSIYKRPIEITDLYLLDLFEELREVKKENKLSDIIKKMITENTILHSAQKDHSEIQGHI